MEQKDFLKLAAKVADGKASDEELRRYAAIFEQLQQGTEASWNTEKYGNEEQLAAKLNSRLQPIPGGYLWRRFAVAAAVLVFVSVSGYFLLIKSPQPPSRQVVNRYDIVPGHNSATLILANGKKIVINHQLNGQVATQGQTKINVLNGQLVYQPSAANGKPEDNTLTTARGEQSPYPVVLSDGTRVWLNAQSSLTFPAAFTARERVVKLSGEAYFEIKHNAAHPFKIYTNGGIIEDIGTHFNINAYPDEKEESATLLEGAVKITTPNGSRLLKPGEQARYTRGNLRVLDVDAEEAVAWKNGYFMFTDDPLQEVMQQLSRWYNVDIQFEDESLKQITFVASITRFTNISKVLKVLEMTRQVRFEIEGRLIKVYPYQTH